MVVQLSSTSAQCVRITRCELQVIEWRWPLAARHAAGIAAEWQRRQAKIPGLFNGAIYLARTHLLDSGVLSANLFRSDFSTMLYWRAYPDAIDEPVREVFGASLIRSAEGDLLLGKQGPGQLNSGRIYPPGGLIDDADVSGGAVDIDASVARELGEETGLSGAELQRMPGYLLAFSGLKIAVGIEWRSTLGTAALRQRILDFARRQADPELEDIVPVRSRADIDEERMPPHAQAFVRTVMSA